MSRRVSNPPQTPLNSDDALERSLRRQRGSSRQRESLADVARRVNESPVSTPVSGSSRRRFSGRFVVGDSGGAAASSPVSLGDFQEWMKMVRLKRVKANNAFTIQLIDCFHSMVRGASFQEATHTLGGCLTVYKNRIASVKDDTSKLLVGVTEKKGADAATYADVASEDDSDGEDSDEKRARRRRKERRRMPGGADAFLVPSVKLEIDTNELATTIDPLLRKMSADFDKRGAGALLQYSLKPDQTGRLLLDAEAAEAPDRQLGATLSTAPSIELENSGRKLSSIAEMDEEESIDTDESQRPASTDSSEPRPRSREFDMADSDLSTRRADIAHFNVAYFANIDWAATEAVPNVDGIAAAVNNPEEGTEALVRSMQAWEMNDPSDTSIYAGQEDNASPVQQDDAQSTPAVFEPAPELGLGFDVADDGMDWDDQLENGDEAAGSPVAETSIVSIRPPPDGNWLDVGFLRKVDAQQSNWAGPSFWKIRRLRARDAVDLPGASSNAPQQASNAPSTSRKGIAKAPTIIDFTQESEVDVSELFSPGKSAIYLSSRQFDETNKHLLPVDMRVTTAQLINLSLRPHTGVAPAFMREAWSVGDISTRDATIADESNTAGGGDMNGSNVLDNNNQDGFFYGDWDDVDPVPTFGDQRPQTASAMFSQSQPTQLYGSQRHQLNYARVAKHVDVRKLKDNVWQAISNETEAASGSSATTLLNVIHETQPQYSEQQRADLSPAMYFISLLHLSNEKGMKLENVDGLTDIRIVAHQ